LEVTYDLLNRLGFGQENGSCACPACGLIPLELRVDPEGLAVLECEECEEPAIWERLRALSAEARERAKARTGPPRPKGMSAKEIERKEFRPMRYAVERLVGEGTTLLVGNPKSGKSWAALAIAIAVASERGKVFGSLRCEHGDVCYLALEDTFARIQDRMKKILGGSPAPEGLEFFCEWPSINHGGLELLEDWLREHPDARLVIIDTLQRIRANVGADKGGYANDYAEMAALKKVADNYGVSLLVVHHTRKGASEDPFLRVSGTQGIMGSADTTLVLDRDHGNLGAVLHCTGRDVRDAKLDLLWNPNCCSWALNGNGSGWD
jgi:predicted ATP-dependent serine protease